MPYDEPGIEHAWHLYVLRMRPEQLRIGRNQFVELLRERGVGTSVHCIPLTRCTFTRSATATAPAIFRSPKTSTADACRCRSIAAMSDEDVAYVIETVLALVRENRR